MLIKSTLVASSEQRFKQAHFSPTELNRKLGDGPIQMTAEQKLHRQRQLLEQTEDAQAAQRLLGNMVLLRSSQNRDIGNLSFAEKKKVFEQSGYSVTNEVATFPEWTMTQIRDRQAG